MAGLATMVQSRKAQRKQDRKRKRNKQAAEDPVEEQANPPPPSSSATTANKTKKKAKPDSTTTRGDPINISHTNKNKKNSPYDVLDSTTAAALQRDDEEIAYLERSLGLASKNSKQKQRLNKEYAKLEGYGDDFGDFLNDVDDMVHTILAGGGKESDNKALLNNNDNDDDSMLDDDGDEYNQDQGEFSDDTDEELLPMKDPASDLDEDDSVMEELEAEELKRGREYHHDSSEDDEADDEIPESDDEADDEPVTHDDDQENTDMDEDKDDDRSDEASDASNNEQLQDTYHPSEGEDIYGNKTADNGSQGDAPSKYVPPHLRKQAHKASETAANDEAHQEALRQIRRSLNQILNRLSEDTIISVCQEIVQKVYPSHPTSLVNDSIWNNTKNACVATHLLMSGLIPVYAAAITGMHYLKSDSAQLGEYMTEQIVLELWKQRQQEITHAKDNDETDATDVFSDKVTSNLMLILCYLYNFGVVHCTLLFDLIRECITNFSENDIELLLLVMSHSGRLLRTDDPSSLKDIVVLVHKRALEVKGTFRNYSRVDYMVSAINDLKNNKKRRQDETFVQKTAKLRKMLGQIKSLAAKTSTRTDSSLRLSLDDILNAETKGRWWKVGASWVGNQYQFVGDGSETSGGADKNNSKSGQGTATVSSDLSDKEQARLLKLAAKYRMNTDVRRSIFCIIMGAADCEDAFEKLVRAGMLKGRNERETVRVLMECCGNEKEFNKVYAYLAARLVEYQPQCKFSFQLAFWDTFKQFERMTIRKAANYAKLLFQLVAVHHALKLNILKAIDMASPDELPESAMIFVTLFLSSIFDHFETPLDVAQLFQTGISHKSSKKESSAIPAGDELESLDEGEALRASLTIFLVRVLKSSPKYQKGSRFRVNLKAALKACDTDGMMT